MITSQALLDSRAYSFLEYLCDHIGPRVTGSTEAAQATNWAVDTMKAIGLANVHVENWHLDRSWRRGTATAELLKPFGLPLNVVSYGWAGSTRRGGVEAEVIAVNSDLTGGEIAGNAGGWAGKVLLLTSKGPKHISGAERLAQPGSLLEAAGRAGAVAVIARDPRPRTMLTHTGPPGFSGAFYSIAALDIASEHQRLLERLLASPFVPASNVYQQRYARPRQRNLRFQFWPCFTAQHLVILTITVAIVARAQTLPLD